MNDYIIMESPDGLAGVKDKYGRPVRIAGSMDEAEELIFHLGGQIIPKEFEGETVYKRISGGKTTWLFVVMI